MRIDQSTVRTVAADLQSIPLTAFSGFRGHVWAQAGPRRVIASDDMSQEYPLGWMGIELHSDGAGCQADRLQSVFDISGREVATGNLLLDDESIVAQTIRAVQTLATHARDRCAASGTTLLRVRIRYASDTGLSLGHSRTFASQIPGTRSCASVRPGEAYIDLDELCDKPVEMLAAVHVVLSDLFHSFGLPELLQIDRDGQLRSRYWGRSNPMIQAWAADRDVAMSGETVL